MATKYPQNIDDDSTLPATENGATEISGDTLNSLKDATQALEKAVGVNPQGNRTDLASRISVSIDQDGNLKTSALEDRGLVALPVVDADVDDHAAIKEAKLALDYSTSYLKGLSDSETADIDGLQSGLGAIAPRLNGHIAGISDFHDVYAIHVSPTDTASGILALNSTSAGQALNYVGELLLSGTNTAEPHIDTTLPAAIKHKAVDVSVDTSNFEILSKAATTVQAALDSLDAAEGVLAGEHITTFHSNGILKQVQSGSVFNTSQRKIVSTSASYVLGSSVVTLPSANLTGVVAGDLLTIETTTALDAGTYQIVEVGPVAQVIGNPSSAALTAYQVLVLHTFKETSTVTASIYGAKLVSSDAAPLACSVVHNGTLVDTIAILNPQAARVVSMGFNGAIINGDGYDLRVEVGVGAGQTRTITVSGLNLYQNAVTQAWTVDAESVAERINAYVLDPNSAAHFPITAFRVGNELAIAHNWVGADYILEILPSPHANYALGFDVYGSNVVSQTITGNLGSSYVVNGRELGTIATLLTGTATISDTNVTIKDSNGNTLNPTEFGVGAGSVMNLTGHSTADMNGNYMVYAANSTCVTVHETISASTTPLTAFFTGSFVPLQKYFSQESSQKGIIQVGIDANGLTEANQRLMYTTLGYGIELIDVSESFAAGTYTFYIGDSGGGLRGFTLIDTSTSLPGPTVSVATTFSGVFKLYAPNNLDYLTIEVVPTLAGIASTTQSLTLFAAPDSDELMMLCNAHFVSSKYITHLYDTRLFGNMALNQVRDDFVEVFSQLPAKEMRSNGVVRGFDLAALPYSDSETGLQAVPLMGGVAYVNGTRVAVVTQKAIISSAITSGTVVIGINEFGSIQAFTESLGEILTDGYGSSYTYGKILPLYSVAVVGGVINQATLTDLRLFIDNLDEKQDLTVDSSNYNFLGNFKTLDGALQYITSYPSSEKTVVKIVGQVLTSKNLVVPAGVNLLGATGLESITNTGAAGNFITLAGNNKLRDLQVLNTSGTGALVAITGSSVEVSNCYFNFASATNSGNTAITATGALDDIKIDNNSIGACYSGVVCDGQFSTTLQLTNNSITGVSGTSASAYGLRVVAALGTSNSIVIEGNTISIPSVTGGNISGIAVDVGQNIGSVRISKNNISEAIPSSTGSLTYGISVFNENNVGPGNKASNLFITDNIIQDVQLADSNIWGIWVGNATIASITGNQISGIGDVSAGSYTNVGAINISTGLADVDVSHNTIADGDASFGIRVNDISNTAKVKISSNTISNVGGTVTCICISSNTSYASISDNTIIGTGSGTFIVLAAGGHSNCSTVAGNVMVGSGSIGVSVPGVSTSISIVNNVFADISSAGFQCISLSASTTNCFVSGNQLPYAGVGFDSVALTESAMGAAYPDTNTNTIGVNAGLLDTRSVPAADMASSYDSVSGVNWTLTVSSGVSYWQPGGASNARVLCVPIQGLPNGSQLESVGVMASIVTLTKVKVYSLDLITLTPTLISDTVTLPLGVATTNVAVGGIIDNLHYTYYAIITSSDGISNLIYGARVNFRY
jgi:hypothetical protein